MRPGLDLIMEIASKMTMDVWLNTKEEMKKLEAEVTHLYDLAENTEDDNR